MHDDWKSGEFSYCRNLVLSRGDNNVGRSQEAVASYLELQASSAQRDLRPDLASRLLLAGAAVASGDWRFAEKQF